MPPKCRKILVHSIFKITWATFSFVDFATLFCPLGASLAFPRGGNDSSSSARVTPRRLKLLRLWRLRLFTRPPWTPSRRRRRAGSKRERERAIHLKEFVPPGDVI